MRCSNLEGHLIQTPIHCYNSPFYSETRFLLQQLPEQHSSLSIKSAPMRVEAWNQTVLVQMVVITDISESCLIGQIVTIKLIRKSLRVK